MAQMQDFYTVEAIKERLSVVLGSDKWTNFKNTDLGQILINWGANVVNQQSIALFTAINQLFLSSVDMSSYLEFIARSFGIVPQTMYPAQLTISIVPDNSSSIQPLDFSLKIGNVYFYNIEEIIFTASETKIITLYEGTPRRFCTSRHTPTSMNYTYELLPSIYERDITAGSLGSFLYLETSAFVDSILVHEATTINLYKIPYTKVDNFYSSTASDRVFMLEKDPYSRYLLIYGDGNFGVAFDSTKINYVVYLQTNGLISEITDYTSYSLLLDGIDVSADYTVTNIGTMINGRSTIDFEDLFLETKLKVTTGNRLVTKEDHVNYLNSRSDVVDSVLVVERDYQNVDVSMSNVIQVACKPEFEGTVVDTENILEYFYNYALPTVTYSFLTTEYVKFDILLAFDVLQGVVRSVVETQIDSVLTDRMSWNNLGLAENLTGNHITSLLVQGEVYNIYYPTMTTTFKVYYTDTQRRITIPTEASSSVIALKIKPKQGTMRIESAVLDTGYSNYDAANKIQGLIGAVLTDLCTVDYNAKTVTFLVSSLTNYKLYFEPDGNDLIFATEQAGMLNSIVKASL